VRGHVQVSDPCCSKSATTTRTGEIDAARSAAHLDRHEAPLPRSAYLPGAPGPKARARRA
jgi:hypothetical protein